MAGLKSLAVLVALAGIGTVAADRAKASTITSTAPISFSSVSSDSTPASLLNAMGTFNVYDDGTIALTLDNLTNAPSGYTISEMYFNSTPNVTALSFLNTSPYFSGATLQQNQAADAFGTFRYKLDFGTWNTGIASGQSDVIRFGYIGSAVDAHNFTSTNSTNPQGQYVGTGAIRYTQGPNGDSAFGLAKAPESVPEPSTRTLTLIGFGAGLGAGLTYMSRSRKRS